MKNIVIRGPLLTVSGYGEHARQVFKWLASLEDTKISAQLTPWGNTTWYINPDLLGGLVGQIMSCSGPLERAGADVSFQIQLPNEWDPMLARFNVGVTAAVETDICNSEWVDACNKMDPVSYTHLTLPPSDLV